ncbi:site-2 protease family protein [Patescibacteria group bacterium]|nr:site-2 protease family protein [Patescibacteria group bacterium]
MWLLPTILPLSQIKHFIAIDNFPFFHYTGKGEFLQMSVSLFIGLVILVYSAILHEVAHGFVADKLGDPTARLAGRLTLNPKNHIDPMMSIALPLLLYLNHSSAVFGAAKPVPVDYFNLKEGRKDIALVSLAGPLTNVLLAVAASILIRVFSVPFIEAVIPSFLSLIIYFLLSSIITYNLLLAIFNLIPIPPLDGSKVFALLLPEEEANIYLSIGSVGMFILFFLLLFPLGGFSLGSFIFNLTDFARGLLIP